MNELIQEKSMVDRMVAYSGQYMSLTLKHLFLEDGIEADLALTLAHAE